MKTGGKYEVFRENDNVNYVRILLCVYLLT